jgi:hypothetical protein
MPGTSGGRALASQITTQADEKSEIRNPKSEIISSVHVD